MGRKKDILDKLAERLANGEISESTYLAIKERYDKEGFPDEEEDAPEVREIRIRLPSIPDVPIADIHGAVPTIIKGDFEGEEYRVMGVGKVGGDCACTNAEVMGVGKINGGFHGETFKVAGTCKVGEDVETQDLSVSGIVKVQGKVSSECFSNSGTMKVAESIAAKELTTSGLLRVGGDVETERFENSGTTKVAGRVEADDILQSGVLKVGDSIKGKTFKSSGAFRVGGPVQADTIEIDLSGHSSAGRVVGTDVKVTARAGSGTLACGEVQGETIYLEATTADLVTGGDVEIGPRCRIEKVVAKTLKAHETAKISTREVGESEDSE